MDSSVLKKVAVEQLRVGMFVNGVAGSWVGHGLWRTKFMISDTEVLESTRQCGAREFWVDMGKSRQPSQPAAVASTLPSLKEPCRKSESATAARSTTFAEETARAVKLRHAAHSAVVTLFDEVRFGGVPNVETVRPLVHDVVESVKRNSCALVSLARLKSKDDYTYMHSVSVCALMVALGRAWGLDDDMCHRLGLGGLFHDLGKAFLPREVLNKPGKLTDEEFNLVKTHPVRGHELLVRAGVTDEVVLSVCLHHHEKVDGTGYPSGTSGDGIALAARMGAVCDVYDAVTSARPYKSAWDPADSLTKMVSWSGHFDRVVLAVFVKMIGVFPTGSLVRLKSGRIATVIENREGAPHRPIVKVFYSTNSQMRVPVQIVDLAGAGVIDKIVSREPRDKWDPAYLDSLSTGALAMRA